MGMALALSRSDSWPFTPTARSHDRSKHQHADDDQEKDERNEQQDSSAQFADHRRSPPFKVVFRTSTTARIVSVSTIMCLRATSRSADSSKRRFMKVFTPPPTRPTRIVMISKFQVNRMTISRAAWLLEEPRAASLEETIAAKKRESTYHGSWLIPTHI